MRSKKENIDELKLFSMCVKDENWIPFNLYQNNVTVCLGITVAMFAYVAFYTGLINGCFFVLSLIIVCKKFGEKISK